MKFILEIKNRCILLIITFTITFFFNFLHKEILLFIFLQPGNVFSTNLLANAGYFILTDITEILKIYWKLNVFLTWQVMMCALCFHLFYFINSALFFTEFISIKHRLKSMFFITIIFNIGMFLIMMPMTWDFFLHFQKLIISQSFNIYFEIKLADCFNFYSDLYFNYTKIFVLCIVVITFLGNKIIANKKPQILRKPHHFLLFLVVMLFDSIEFLLQIALFFLIFIIYEIYLAIFVIKSV